MKNQPFPERVKFAAQGISSAWRTEASFRIQCLAAVLAVAGLVWLGASALWWALILLTVGSVLAAELLNTALEQLVDRLHPDRHPAIKLAKDCAAGAVLILSLTSVAVLLTFLVETFQTRSG